MDKIKSKAKDTFRQVGLVPETIRNISFDTALALSNTLRKLKFFNNDQDCVEILRAHSIGGFSLDEEALTKIFYHPDVINNPVMILSVYGAMRKGKSFLLSLLVSFLESNLDSSCFESSNEIPQHFKWRGGSKKETLGIHMWSKPFILKLNETKKIAVLLMDTQGAFDKDGGKVSSEIFAFSTLMSSVQIYNIDTQIDENHLQPLKMFVDYASILNESLSSDQPNPFQKLQFLIRNWSATEDYNFSEGEKYLDNEMEVSDENPSDVVIVRKCLKNAFSSLNCTLLPYPGGIIAGHEKIQRLMRFSDIKVDFKLQVRSFFSELLKPENRQPKQMNGTDFTGFTAMNFICKYYELLKSGTVLEPISVMEAVEIANAQTVVGNLVEDYNDNMTETLESVSYMEEEDLRKKHKTCKEDIIKRYNNQCKNLQFEKNDLKYKTRLDVEIENAFSTHKQSRKAKEENVKNVYRQVVQNLFGKYQKEINKTSETDLLEKLKERALDEYDVKTKNEISVFKKDFKKKMEKSLLIAITAKEKSIKAEKDREEKICFYLKKYREAMEESLKDSCVSVDELDNLHREIKAAIIEKFHENETDEKHDLLILTHLEASLTSEMDTEYESFKEINQIKLDEVMQIFLGRLEEVKKQHLEFLEKTTKWVYVLPLVLGIIHLKYVGKVKKEHSEWSDNTLYNDLKKKELTALDEQFKTFAANMETRKGLFRESNYGVLLIAAALIVVVSIPALVLGVALAIVAAPALIVRAIWRAVRRD